MANAIVSSDYFRMLPSAHDDHRDYPDAAAR